jgi:hypothetical protein
LATPAAFEVGRHPVKGQGKRTEVRVKTAWARHSIRPMEVREAIPKALAHASPYNEKADELPGWKGERAMAKNERRMARKPATKFPALRKKLQKGRIQPRQAKKK